MLLPFIITITEMCPLKNGDRENANKWKCRTTFSVNQQISSVYPFPGHCSWSDTHNIWPFFEEE